MRVYACAGDVVTRLSKIGVEQQREKMGRIREQMSLPLFLNPTLTTLGSMYMARIHMEYTL